ncbi:MAG: biotin synthase BioB [Verrucomicrobia bacterium]|nr:biotin synthase BioB [Verrucomicrobiota bacterium]
MKHEPDSRSFLGALTSRVLGGDAITFAEAARLVEIESSADIHDLLAAANRIREKFKGNKVHLCSIVNAKAGACPEDCRFCAQSAAYDTGSPRHSFVEQEAVIKAASEAHANYAQGLGIVAAWRGLKEGPMLDEVCRAIEALARSGTARADASLGIIESQRVADRLKAAGLVVYNHNLETAEEHFPNICTTHTYADRVRTIQFLKHAGIRVCSGGIFGMGETRRHRVQMAFALKELAVDVVPMNFLNPIAGTPFENMTPLAPLEILKTIAVYRFILPRKEIMVAGGREVNLRDLQPMIFVAGASATMIGNYLTTTGQDPKKDLQMIRDLGLDPDWGGHWDDEEPQQSHACEVCTPFSAAAG